MQAAAQFHANGLLPSHLEPGMIAQASPQLGKSSTLMTLQDAIARARHNYADYRGAVTEAKIAREDRLQARDAMLPSISYKQQYLGTEGNGTTPNGRYVTNDGVHVYRIWGVLHQEMPAGFFMRSPYKSARAEEAVARARAEIARRGLTVTVTKRYYGLIVAQRKYAIAEQSLDLAQQFADSIHVPEKGGQEARSSLVKARLQVDTQKLAYQQAQLAVDDAYGALAVLVSSNPDENFTVVDDLDNVPSLPSLAEMTAMAERENQDVRIAMAKLRDTKAKVAIARAGFFPTFSLDVDYGIEANALALYSTASAAKQLGPLPNLGYFVTATMQMPIWNWGATHSKLRQSEYRREQAKAELSSAEMQTLTNLRSFYKEASLAASQTGTLRDAADLAAENLRLTTALFRTGKASAGDVVDAQQSLASARSNFADDQSRYRVALAKLQTLTGAF